MEYAVSREGTTLVTVHAGSTTTALDDATDELSSRLDSLVAEGSLSRWSVGDADVYEHPTAPFEPYTLAVPFEVTVRIDAPDEGAAERDGEAVIDRTLEGAAVDGLSYTSDPLVSAS